jgi:uncharacterized protein
VNWKYENGRIYSINENGELLCEATYIRKENGEVNINHTYVNPVLRGQGVAGKMMEVVAEYFCQQGYKTTATCSYAYAWLTRHAEQYANILAPDWNNEAESDKNGGKTKFNMSQIH